MEAQCKKFGVVAQRISAITKDQATYSTIDLRTANNFTLKQKTSHLDLDSWGNAACFQSHRAAWNLILEKRWEKAWILEDDAIIKRIEDIEVSTDTPFVWLGLRGVPKMFSIPEYPYKVLNYDRECFGAHGYCLHATLAPILLDNSTTLSFSPDYFLNEFLFFKGIRAGVVDLAYTNEFLSFSDIEHTPIGKSSSYFSLSAFLILMLFVLYLTHLALAA